MSAIAHPIRSVSLVVVALLVVGCQGKPPIDQWKTVSHAPFRFKMPGEAKREVKSIAAPPPLGKLDLTMYMWDRKNFGYMVGVSEYPAGTLDRVGIEDSLAGSRDGHVANTPGGKLLGSKRVEVHGSPAIEFTFEATMTDAAKKDKKFMNYVRTVRSGEKAIIMQLSGFPGEIDEAQAQEFWNTLEIEAPKP
jgi:hypothetical protein